MGEARAMIHQVVIMLIPIYILSRINRFFPLLSMAFKGLVRTAPPRANDLLSFATRKPDVTPGEAVPDFQIPRDAPYVPATAAIHIQDIVTEPLADKLAEVLVLGIAALATTLVHLVLCLVFEMDSTKASGALFLCLALLLDGCRVGGAMTWSLGRVEIFFSMALAFFIFAATFGTWLGAGEHFDIPLADGYEHLKNATLAITNDTNPDFMPRFPKLQVVNLGLVVSAGLVGITMIFPAFRVARSHFQGVQVYGDQAWRQLLLHGAFLAPALVFASFLRIASVDIVRAKLGADASETRVQHVVMCARVALIFLTLALRIMAYPMHMQCYLNLAQQRLAEYLDFPQSKTDDADSADAGGKDKAKAKKKKTTRDTVSAGTIQQLVLGVWAYAPAAALQLLLPPILLAACGAVMLLQSPWLAAAEPASTAGFLGALAAATACWLSGVMFAFSALGVLYLRMIRDHSGRTAA